LFEQPTPEPRTDGNACSLLPTPTANCSTGPGRSGRQGGANLQTAVALLPTPLARPSFGYADPDATQHHLANALILGITAAPMGRRYSDGRTSSAAPPPSRSSEGPALFTD
jgi:hypothetical protein